MNTSESTVPTPLRELFSKILKVAPDEIHPDSSTKSVRNWDSMRHVELVVEVEELYGVSFSAVEVFGLNSVQGFCDMLRAKNVDLSAAFGRS